MTHLEALQLRLSNERCRYAADRSHLRKVWIAQIEKEIANEVAFLAKAEPEMTDDELLAELEG